MPTPAVAHQDVAGYQRQYGTLWRACEIYLDRRMPDEQMAAFELVIDPGFLSAVALARFAKVLVEVATLSEVVERRSV